MSVVDQIRLSYPLPIAKFYEAMCLENEPRQRVRKLIDLFEGISRYLVLIGLASYIYHEVSDSKVEESRPELERPSLGSWVKLLRLLDAALRSDNTAFLLADPNRIYRGDSIFEANRALAQITGVSQPRRVKLIHFFDSVVRFRNDKIGHGSLSLREAKRVLEPLESAISQWLADLPILHQQHVVYIDRVEWWDPHFVYYGTNLNSGTSLFPLKLERDKPVTPGQVYLHQPANGSLVPLYPFLVFDDDTRLLYTYDKLSGRRELVLRCSYEVPTSAETTRHLSFDESIITGAKPDSGPTASSGSRQNHRGATVSKYTKTLDLIKTNLTENWLTDSQKEVWTQLSKLMEPPYYVVNIYGASGTGKTFLGWLLQKQKQALYADASDPSWRSWQGQPLIVLDGYDSSRRAVRSLRSQLQLCNIGQSIILTRQKAQDDIPCLHLAVTDRDVQIVKATLYRELEMIIPEGNQRNLWDCLKHLEE